MTAKTPDMTALPLQDPRAYRQGTTLPRFDNGDAATALQVPQRIAFSAWTGHIPFAFWVTRQCAPRPSSSSAATTASASAPSRQQAPAKPRRLPLLRRGHLERRRTGRILR